MYWFYEQHLKELKPKLYHPSSCIIRNPYLWPPTYLNVVHTRLLGEIIWSLSRLLVQANPMSKKQKQKLFAAFRELWARICYNMKLMCLGSVFGLCPFFETIIFTGLKLWKNCPQNIPQRKGSYRNQQQSQLFNWVSFSKKIK